METEELKGRTIYIEEIMARSVAAFEGLATAQTIATKIAEFIVNIKVNNNLTAAQDFLNGVLRGFETLMKVAPTVGQLTLQCRFVEAQKGFYFQEGILTAFAAMGRLAEVGLARNDDQARINLEQMKMVIIGMMNKVQNAL